MRPGEFVGHYKLVRPLGAGGQATVWEVRRSDGAGPFALKLQTELSGPLRERALLEGGVLRSVSDPGVPRFEEVVPLGQDTVAVVMELVHAQTLSEVVAARPLGAQEKRAILTETARVLSVLHRSGVIHRDIKPSNVLLRPGWERAAQGNVVLVDMGIAKVVDSTRGLTRQGVVMGTAAFVAPELFLSPAGSSHATPAADVFSWGVIAWTLLFGQHPTGLAMDAPPHHYLLAYQRGGQAWVSPPPAAALARGVSDAALVTTAVRALREEPTQRCRDGGEVLASLAQWGPPTNLAMSFGGAPYTRLELDASGASASGQPAPAAGGYTHLELPPGAIPCSAVSASAPPLQVAMAASSTGVVPAAFVAAPAPRSRSSALIIGLALTGGVLLLGIGVAVAIVASGNDQSSSAAPQPAPTPALTTAPPAATTADDQAARQAAQLQEARREAPSLVTVTATNRCSCMAGHRVLVQCRIVSHAAVPVRVGVSASAETAALNYRSSGTAPPQYVPAGGTQIVDVNTQIGGAFSNCSSVASCSCAKLSVTPERSYP